MQSASRSLSVYAPSHWYAILGGMRPDTDLRSHSRWRDRSHAHAHIIEVSYILCELNQCACSFGSIFLLHEQYVPRWLWPM